MPTLIKCTLNDASGKPTIEATGYAQRLSQLAIHSRDLVRDLDPSNDLTFLRVSCKKLEMMIAPDKNYFLIVVQEPLAEKTETVVKKEGEVVAATQ